MAKKMNLETIQGYIKTTLKDAGVPRDAADAISSLLGPDLASGDITRQTNLNTAIRLSGLERDEFIEVFHKIQRITTGVPAAGPGTQTEQVVKAAIQKGKKAKEAPVKKEPAKGPKSPALFKKKEEYAAAEKPAAQAAEKAAAIKAPLAQTGAAEVVAGPEIPRGRSFSDADLKTTPLLSSREIMQQKMKEWGGLKAVSETPKELRSAKSLAMERTAGIAPAAELEGIEGMKAALPQQQAQALEQMVRSAGFKGEISYNNKAFMEWLGLPFAPGAKPSAEATARAILEKVTRPGPKPSLKLVDVPKEGVIPKKGLSQIIAGKVPKGQLVSWHSPELPPKGGSIPKPSPTSMLSDADIGKIAEIAGEKGPAPKSKGLGTAKWLQKFSALIALGLMVEQSWVNKKRELGQMEAQAEQARMMFNAPIPSSEALTYQTLLQMQGWPGPPGQGTPAQGQGGGGPALAASEFSIGE
jgi:hypothetical protein